jgi:transcriptional regulator with XRE-family HTH domain
MSSKKSKTIMKIDSIDSIGQRVVECRKEKGMTQAELVRQTGLAKQTVLNLEKEYRPPNLGTILRVSKVFGVTLDWLVTGKGPKFRKC